ncbi:DUF2744 domain-containing protein [Rhodococcus erythropolis]|uniref:phage gene 29 protein family protein n=1 Tax=Rhodococcus erythropolis TaxID=1833 RepID=UPI001E3259C5|nr:MULTISPECIES: DUF2744 domain-containing protein [Rhodococcus erythropolis group]MCD2109351.1 DUF2744 domain-containing protein [Rhodococcus qingshengii]MCZ4528276.1 DUF2744 domain-containing protein [Rhodococcus erythropolis]
MAIPTQATADMDDPEEHVLWALMGSITTPDGDALITTEECLRKTSRILTEAGFRHVPELQVRKQIIPGGMESVHWMGVGAVEWVDIDTPDPEVALAPVSDAIDLDAMSGSDLIRLAERLQERGVIRPPEEGAPTEDVAQVRTIEVDY